MKTHRLARIVWIIMVVATAYNLGFTPNALGDDLAASSPASQPAPVTAEERLQRLEERQAWLEETLKLEKEANQKRVAEAPIAGAGPDGFYLKSANGDYILKLRGLIQADGRFVQGDDSDTTNDKFLLRRVRPIFEGTVAKYVDFRITPDFGDGKTTLVDAYLDFKYFTQAQLRVGKFAPPFGLERLQSASDTKFVEYSLSNQLTPNRDIGAMLHGDLFKGVLIYQAGIFNGVADDGSTDSDLNGAKELAARIFVHPFKKTDVELLQGLGVGTAVTYGSQSGSGYLPTYKTAGRETFFKYLSGAEADGGHVRVSPQAYYYYKSFGIMGEWIQSSQEVSKGDQRDRIANSGWQVTSSYLLTGEKASYKGVDPIKPFDPRKGGWGAWEIAVRYSQLDTGSNAFPTYADPSKSAESARAFGVGLNWYLNKNVKFMLDYEQTAFSGGSAKGDRDDEHAAFAQVQLSF